MNFLTIRLQDKLLAQVLGALQPWEKSLYFITSTIVQAVSKLYSSVALAV